MTSGWLPKNRIAVLGRRNELLNTEGSKGWLKVTNRAGRLGKLWAQTESRLVSPILENLSQLVLVRSQEWGLLPPFTGSVFLSILSVCVGGVS